MRGVKKIVVCLAFLSLFIASHAEALPKNHAKLLKNEDYKSNYTLYENIMEEAKGRLSGAEYAKLKADCEAQIDLEAEDSRKGGESEADAYATAYIVANERVSKELIFDWLRKNTTGVQGFYRLGGGALDGYMTIQEGDLPEMWAVYIYAGQKKEPLNNGELQGEGKLDGGRMTVDYGNDDASATVAVIFEGETARVETSKAFKESGWLGANVLLDGTYTREKK